MKKLHFAGQVFEAQRIVKNSSSIRGFIEEKEVFVFRGIKDFSAFTLGEGQEYDMAELTEFEKLRIEQAQANAELVQLIMTMGGK